MSREVVEETLLILQENQRDFLLELVDPVPRWMFSIPDPPESLIRPSAAGKMKFPISLGNIASFALSLLEQIPDASIVSNS